MELVETIRENLVFRSLTEVVSAITGPNGQTADWGYSNGEYFDDEHDIAGRPMTLADWIEHYLNDDENAEAILDLFDSISCYGFMPEGAIQFVPNSFNDGGRLGNGHHRLITAILMNLDEIPTASDWGYHSCWKDTF